MDLFLALQRTRDFGEPDYYVAWDRFWRDLFGATARNGLESLARRIYELERRERVTIETLQRLAAEAAGERAKPFEAMHAALHESHTATLARLESYALQVESQRDTIEAVRDALQEHVERLEGVIAALPEGLRADLRIELDNLRNTPDAVTALLYGAETFAGAVARSLEEAQ